jgi:hypothetical protein
MGRDYVDYFMPCVCSKEAYEPRVYIPANERRQFQGPEKFLWTSVQDERGILLL